MKVEEKKFHIDYGELSTENENFIVADKKGLYELKNAIDEAIETGKSTKKLDMFYGVICHEKEFFEKKEVYKPTILQKTYGYLSGFLLVAIMFSGIYTILKWLFSIFN